jgi:lipopolysaccharide transport protein LptA/LPS export ABC transporter protein LptC
MADVTTSISPNRSHAAADALGLWEPKRTLTLAAARAHTSRIQFLRRLLLVLAAGLVGLLVYYFLTQGPQTEWEDDPDTSVRMVNPRYSGRTADGLPYFLTSDTATRQQDSRNEVALVKPVLEFIRASGAEASYVEADAGQYNDVTKVLDLRIDASLPDGERKDVVLETDDGVRCVTTHARIFARDKRIEGKEPIRCTGNFGVVTGQAFEVNENYTVFVFKDGMTGIIEQDPADGNGATGAFGPAGEGPINITAERADYKDGRTDLSGDVVVIQDGSTVYSDDMVILRQAEDNSAAGSLNLGAVQQITGTGDFRYVSEDNDVRGDRGVYQRDTGIVTVTGDVRVVQPGGNTVSTDRLRYDTRTETIRFSGNCQGRDCGGSGRTNITIRQE